MADHKVDLQLENGHIKGAFQYRDVKQMWKDILTLGKRTATIAGFIGCAIFSWQTRTQQADLQNQINTLKQKYEECRSDLQKRLEDRIQELQKHITRGTTASVASKPARQQMARR